MCELSGSPRSSSLREFYYSCVSLQSDPSRAFSLPLYAHIHSNLLCPSSFRHRTFTWKWNGSLRVGVGAACTHMMVSNFNVAVIAEAFSVVYGIITILEKSCKKCCHNRFNNFFNITKRTGLLNYVYINTHTHTVYILKIFTCIYLYSYNLYYI